LLNPDQMHPSAERDHFAHGTRQHQLCALLRDLTAEERILLELRIVDEHDYADIAVNLGVPHADLVRRVRRPTFGAERMHSGRAWI